MIQKLHRDTSKQVRKERAEADLLQGASDLDAISYDSLVNSVNKQALAVSHRIFRDSLPEIQKSFRGYEVVPFKMMRADSPDVICIDIPSDLNSVPPFVRGGAWWAYNFGESEQMPKNDVPNISAMAMPWSLDLAINAELRTSQSVMKRRIAEEPSQFDEIVFAHGNLQFQILLKLEHQPRFYHWIPIARWKAGTWNSVSLLDEVTRISSDYSALRNGWVSWIEKKLTEVSRAQIEHMQKRNQTPNLALRLVRPFRREDLFWSLPYEDQVKLFSSECRRLKPFIDFFR